MGISKMFNLMRKYRDNEDINIDELNDIIRMNTNYLLIDVRSPQEYKEGHLNGATNIPLYELETCCDCKLKDKDMLIIVYCQSGLRSKKAIKVLKKCGFKNLYHLENGLDGI